MTRTIRARIGRLVSLLLILVGIFWVPKDLQDWEVAAEPWKRVLSMLDQNTLLWVFAISLFAWVAWRDARPFLIAWAEKFGRPQRPDKAPLDEDGPSMTIGRALNYLLLESEWGYDKQQWQPYGEMDDALRNGSIRSWGQLCLTPMDQIDTATMTGGPKFSGVTTKLTKDDWERLELIERWIMFQDQPNAWHPHLAWRRKGAECDSVYGRIRVNEREIKEKWPPRR